MAFHDLTNSTICCEGCEWLVQPHGSSIGSRCVKCSDYRQTLNRMLFRAKDKQDIDLEHCEPGSHTNYRYLSTPEKCIRLQRLHNKWIVSRYVINPLLHRGFGTKKSGLVFCFIA